MDALKYLKEINRMCKLMKECADCPFHGCGLTFPCEGNEGSAEYKDAEKCISIVEKWSAEHPIKTRQSEFLKMFPNAKVSNGVISICPKHIDSECGADCEEDCTNCRKNYWFAEVE